MLCKRESSHRFHTYALGASKEDRERFVDAVVQMLQLTEVANEQVRDILLDQKKRTRRPRAWPSSVEPTSQSK